MAIDTHCPFCDKAYRLKDDLAGKKVTCANQACRKAFTVTPSTNGSAKPAAPPPPVPPQLDAEAFAAAALKEDADANPGPEDTRTIEMTCTICEHKWTVAWAMQGKNTLCPDCKTRQKVPEQKQAKKADWRDGSGRPTLAKVEALEGVQTSTEARHISGETIREAGLVEIQYEPRPLSFYLKILLPALVVVVGVGTFAWWKWKARSVSKHDDLVAVVYKAVDSEEIKGLAPEQVPLYRAAMFVAAGEYEARRDNQEHRDRAVRNFADARAELEKAKKSAERDSLFGELVVGMLVLGGDEAQVKEHLRLSWVPVPPKAAQVRLKQNPAEAEGVQGQLRRAMEAMKGADFDVRAATARRAARVLIPVGQAQMLLDTLQAGFTTEELPEVRAQVGLELVRAGQKDKAKEVAEGLKAMLAPTPPPPTNPNPVSAHALWKAVELDKTRSLAAEPAPGGDVSDDSRMAYVELYLVQGKPAEALELAKRPGKPDGKVKALAMAAEWAAEPGPFVDAAADVVAAEAKKKGTESLPQGSVLARLAAAAGRAGMAEKVGVFTDPRAMVDEGMREWAKAEAYRQGLKATPGAEAKETDADVPADPRKFRLGHAWGRLALARHNATRTGDKALARQYILAWPTNTVGPFGSAGVALGVQDAERK